MAKETGFLNRLEKKDKAVFFALAIAVFGALLFLAFALTLPWDK